MVDDNCHDCHWDSKYIKTIHGVSVVPVFLKCRLHQDHRTNQDIPYPEEIRQREIERRLKNASRTQES